MSWLSELPTDLQERAYVYEGEAAWSRNAIEVIRALSTLGKGVLGVEVWLQDRWSCANSLPVPSIVGLCPVERNGP